MTKNGQLPAYINFSWNCFIYVEICIMNIIIIAVILLSFFLKFIKKVSLFYCKYNYIISSLYRRTNTLQFHIYYLECKINKIQQQNNKIFFNIKVKIH